MNLYIFYFPLVKGNKTVLQDLDFDLVSCLLFFGSLHPHLLKPLSLQGFHSGQRTCALLKLELFLSLFSFFLFLFFFFFYLFIFLCVYERAYHVRSVMVSHIQMAYFKYTVLSSFGPNRYPQWRLIKGCSEEKNLFLTISTSW